MDIRNYNKCAVLGYYIGAFSSWAVCCMLFFVANSMWWPAFFCAIIFIVFGLCVTRVGQYVANKFVGECKSGDQESTLEIFEEYVPNKFRRRIRSNGHGEYCLDISHNMVEFGINWSAWTRWGTGKSIDELRNRHNIVLMRR